EQGIDGILGHSVLPTATVPVGVQATAVAGVVRQATSELPARLTAVLESGPAGLAPNPVSPTPVSPTQVSPTPVSPATVSGATVAGARVSGATVSGATPTPATPPSATGTVKPVTAESLPGETGRAKFEALAGRYGVDPASHPALASEFQREFVAGHNATF